MLITKRAIFQRAFIGCAAFGLAGFLLTACEREEEAALEHAHRGAGWDGVKISDHHVLDRVILPVQRNLVKVPVLALREEEEHGLLLVRRAAHDERPSLRWQV